MSYGDLKQDGILCEELGKIAIPKRSNKYNVFSKIRIFSFKSTGHYQHLILLLVITVYNYNLTVYIYRFDSSHSKIIMILLRQLLTAQLVHLYHLASQILGRLKTFWVQDDLSNKSYDMCLSYYNQYILQTHHNQEPSLQMVEIKPSSCLAVQFFQHSRDSLSQMLRMFELTLSHDLQTGIFEAKNNDHIETIVVRTIIHYPCCFSIPNSQQLLCDNW